jgi:hypothetical protein
MYRAIVIAIAMTVAVVCAATPRDWQTGTTLSSERQERVCGDTACIYQEFRFQGEKKIYTARETLRWRWSKEANVTVNAPVKFAVDAKERRLYVIDDGGKEHEMEVVSKALR